MHSKEYRIKYFLHISLKITTTRCEKMMNTMREIILGYIRKAVKKFKLRSDNCKNSSNLKKVLKTTRLYTRLEKQIYFLHASEHSVNTEIHVSRHADIYFVITFSKWQKFTFQQLLTISIQQIFTYYTLSNLSNMKVKQTRYLFSFLFLRWIVIISKTHNYTIFVIST